MNNQLADRLGIVIVEEYEIRAKETGKPYDRATLARNIVNGLLIGFTLPKRDVEIILEKHYGQRLNLKGSDLYEPMKLVILNEWERMGEKNREIFGDASRIIVENFELQTLRKETKH